MASTITRTSGSVPLGRSSTRPASPSRASSSATADHTASASSSSSVSGTGTLTSTWGTRVDQAVEQLGQRRSGPGHQVGQDQAGQQAVAGGGQPAEDDVARLLAAEGEPVLVQGGQHVAVARPAVSLTMMPRSSMARRNPRLVITVTTTVLPASWPRSARSRANRASSSSPSTSVAVGVDGQQPVGVAVEGQAQVGPVLDHGAGQQRRWRWTRSRR